MTAEKLGFQCMQEQLSIEGCDHTYSNTRAARCEPTPFILQTIHYLIISPVQHNTVLLLRQVNHMDRYHKYMHVMTASMAEQQCALRRQSNKMTSKRMKGTWWSQASGNRT